MNRTQTLAVALLVAVLPFTSAAFASDDEEREHAHYDHDRYGHRGDYGQYRNYDEEREHAHYDHDRYGHRGDYGQYRHHGYRGYNRWEDNRPRVVLPLPPLPPFPVIILKKHHGWN